MCSPYNYATTLRSDRHRASQSLFDASFIVEGPSGRFVDRTAIFERSRPKLADREFEWARVRKNGCSGDCASTNPQVSALRSSLCAACSFGSAYVGDTRAEEESRLTRAAQHANAQQFITRALWAGRRQTEQVARRGAPRPVLRQNVIP